ncbi:MAG TPA: gamma-glutamylcyclotransferase [Vicinamibacteria bacterium]
MSFLEADLRALLELNDLRRGGPSPRLPTLEEDFRARFGAHHRLAVYGSLGPGKSNHGQLAGLEGRWLGGLSVRGHLVQEGWGSGTGYPGLRWSVSGPLVDVQLFVSPDLPGHWDRLDRFEGEDYSRILVPLFRDRAVVEVANLYQLSGP